MMPEREPSLLSTGQAAKLCEVTPDTILKWIRRGRLRGTRTAGGHYRISVRDLSPHIPPDRLASRSSEMPSCLFQDLHCWEYLSDKGTIRDDCKKCVVYRVRAARCFRMADLETDVGHARQFCRTSCEECVYYRRAQGLPTNVLAITRDEEFLDRLSSESHDGVTLRLARNGYDASAVIQGFQAAFVVVDEEVLAEEGSGLLANLSVDPRLPGARIVLGVRRGTSLPAGDASAEKAVFEVIEKPFGPRRIAALISRLPVERLAPPDATVVTRSEIGESHGESGLDACGTEF